MTRGVQVPSPTPRKHWSHGYQSPQTGGLVTKWSPLVRTREYWWGLCEDLAH